MSLGDRIKSLRKKNNLSQEQLAEKLNVSRQAVSKWESNIAYPDISNLILLREIFGVTLDYLVIDNNINESENSSNDIKGDNIKSKVIKKTDEDDMEEEEDSYEINLILAGSLIGAAIGIITGNFLCMSAGGFIGMGVGYILKIKRINSN